MSGGNYSMQFVPASVRRRTLVRYRSFGGIYCRHQGVKKKESRLQIHFRRVFRSYSSSWFTRRVVFR